MPCLWSLSLDWFCYIVPPLSSLGTIERKEECDNIQEEKDSFD